MKKILSFIAKALTANSDESSKRLIGFLAFLVICSFGYVAIWHVVKDKEIVTQVISVLAIIVGSAIAGTVFEKYADVIGNKKNNDNKEQNGN